MFIFCVFTSHEAFPFARYGRATTGFPVFKLNLGKFCFVPEGVRGGLTFASTLYGALSRKDEIMCTKGKLEGSVTGTFGNIGTGQRSNK